MASIPDTLLSERGKPPDVLIVIGTSTGGPQALTSLFRQLPLLPKATCLVVQHMPVGFTANLARRLDQISAWHVHEGQPGDMLSAGHVFVAPGGQQMAVSAGRGGTHTLRIGVGELVNGHSPSVDVLFESAALDWPGPIIGVLMTGMGKDGAVGLKDIRNRGGYTIAESEATCVVYGMPKAAVSLGAVEQQADLSKIPPLIVTAYERYCAP